MLLGFKQQSFTSLSSEGPDSQHPLAASSSRIPCLERSVFLACRWNPNLGGWLRSLPLAYRVRTPSWAPLSHDLIKHYHLPRVLPINAIILSLKAAAYEWGKRRHGDFKQMLDLSYASNFIYGEVLLWFFQLLVWNCLFQKTYLFIWKIELQSKRGERKISHMLIHSPERYNNWGEAGLKPEASFWASYMGGRGPNTGVIFYFSPQFFSWELDQKWTDRTWTSPDGMPTSQVVILPTMLALIFCSFNVKPTLHS